jgi:hypothetical protein
MSIEQLVGMYLAYLKDIRMRIGQVEPPAWMAYYVWTNHPAPGGPPEATVSKMLEMRLDRSLASSGIIALNPHYRDCALPIFDVQSPDGHKLSKLILKSNTPDKGNRENILCVALVSHGDSEHQQIYDGIYEVEVVLSDTTGVRVFFNYPEETLARVELHIGESSSLPRWYLKYIENAGNRELAEQLRESLDSLNKLLKVRYDRAMALADLTPAVSPPRGVMSQPQAMSFTSQSDADAEHQGHGETSSNSSYGCIIS